MADLAGSRKNISVEATQFRSAVSESLLQRVGASTNFINNRQYDTHSFHANGRYGAVLAGIGSFPATNFDGIYCAPFDVEVMGLFIFNETSGTSGSTTFDIHRITGGSTDAGTIFSAKPSVASTAANGTSDGFICDPESQSITTFHSTTGFTVGTFTTAPFNLNQGDCLRCDIDAVMGGDPRNISLTLYLRPR